MTIKKLLFIGLFILSSFLLVGCNKETEETADPTRTQVYINFYNGGLGERWLPELKEAFEKLHPEIQIRPIPGKSTMDSGTVLNNFDAYEGDIFFMDYVGSEDLKQFMAKGYTADITKYIKEETLREFNENKSVWDKITPAIKEYYNQDGKIYALPWYQASYQMIYDVALFESESLYVSDDGTFNNGSNKSKGQDGIKGTFDDGLPITQSDFFNLLDKMVEKGITPLTFFGSQAYYFTSYLTNMFADYEGYNDFMLNYVLEGTDSDLGEITLEEAYKLKSEQKGKEYVLRFAQRLIDNPSYYSNNTFQTSQDNFTAQDEFLLSSKQGKSIAMIVEGPWWEREASVTMEDMAGAFGDENLNYGKRRFGIMPMPLADDNSSSEGNTVACTSGRSVIFMNNNSNVKDAAGLFLQFCMSDEGLRIATAYSGMMRPYEYKMTDEYLNLMTPYGRELYQYENNAKIVFEEVPVSEFLQTEGSRYCSYLYTWVSSADTTANVAKYFQPGQQGHTVEAFLKGLENNETQWKDLVEEYRFRTED